MTTEQTGMVLSRREVALEFSEEQQAMIRDAYANGATDKEFAVLLEIARARKLNPLLRQIHFVKRWNNDLRREVWAAQAAIDGLRAIAERTGLYAGQDEPEFEENADGSIKFCRVRVYRSDWPRPAVGVAYWEEYVQTYRDKQSGKQVTSPMWARMPRVMIAKVAESIALRKAFPEDMSGLHSQEEMMQADNDRPDADAPAQQRPRLAPIAAPRQIEAPANDTDPLAAYRARVAAAAGVDELVAVALALAPSVAAHREAAWAVVQARSAELGSGDLTPRVQAAAAITKDPAAWTVVALVLSGIALATDRKGVADVVRAQGTAVGKLPEALQVQLNAARTARLTELTDLAAGFEAELHAAADIPTIEAISDRVVDAFHAQRLTPDQLKALADLQDRLIGAMERAA